MASLIYVGILLSLAGLTVATDLCEESIHEVCGSSGNSIFYPRTAEELETVCEALTDHFECAVKYELECTPDDIAMRDERQDLLNVTKKVCDKNSLLYSVLADNIGCMMRVYNRGEESCYRLPMSEELRKNRAATLLNMGITAFNTPFTEDCLDSYNYLACKAVVMEHICGEMAMDAFIEIFEDLSDYYLWGCNAETKKYFRDIVQMVKLEADIEEELE